MRFKSSQLLQLSLPKSPYLILTHSASPRSLLPTLNSEPCARAHNLISTSQAPPNYRSVPSLQSSASLLHSYFTSSARVVSRSSTPSPGASRTLVPSQAGSHPFDSISGLSFLATSSAVSSLPLGLLLPFCDTSSSRSSSSSRLLLSTVFMSLASSLEFSP